MYLDRVGLLGPGTVLAHGCWLDRAELELIAERGATVVTNPVANLKLAVGRVFPYTTAREAGVAVGLGTDGPGSNNSLDLLADAKTFALLQKNEVRDPAAVTAAETLEIATGQRSRRAPRPTSCSSAATTLSSRSASSTRASSTRRRARSSTPPWSPGGR
jgi:5-methylthioadenosine/S-adenosylhomocysteine deaminase